MSEMVEYWDGRIENAKKALDYAEGQLLRVILLEQPVLPGMDMEPVQVEL